MSKKSLSNTIYIVEDVSTVDSDTCKLHEENIPYNKPVVFAVIQSLGLLEYKVSFDALLYTTYLYYPEDIILAARDAFATLKW